MTIEKLLSSIVQNFGNVEIVCGLKCPVCEAQLSPHAMQHDGTTVTLRCEGCHADVIRCEPVGLEYAD